MFTTANLLGFLALALVIIIVPGPSFVFTIGRALVLGPGPAVLSVAGNVVGVGVQIVAVAFGAGAIVVASPPLFFAIKVLGAGFLIYLGISAFRHRADPLEVSGSDSKVNAKRILSQSFVVGITNAKTLVFFLAAFPQFVSEDGNPITQMLLMGLIFSVIGFFSDSVYAVAAGKARYWFADSGKRLAVLRGAGGILLAILGVYMLVSAFLR